MRRLVFKKEAYAGGTHANPDPNPSDRFHPQLQAATPAMMLAIISLMTSDLTDGHHRQLPRLMGGPFRYKTYAAEFTAKAKKMASKPLKQAVIAPSMLALLYRWRGQGLLAQS